MNSDECSISKMISSTFHFSRASLRENSSYDVLCWSTDAIGNDIMQSMAAWLRHLLTLSQGDVASTVG